MAVQTRLTEEELRKAFADTLDKGISKSAILVSYLDGEQVIIEIGFPYSITKEVLEIGPYLKNIILSPPRDYHERKKQIPIPDILFYRRIELSDMV